MNITSAKIEGFVFLQNNIFPNIFEKKNATMAILYLEC